MKKPSRKKRLDPDRDTLRPEYDFSKGVRGLTAARYAQGTNIVVVDPDVRDVFPDSAAVNDALRALAPVIRRRRVAKRRKASRLTSA
jgi:hypothetical protein